MRPYPVMQKELISIPEEPFALQKQTDQLSHKNLYFPHIASKFSLLSVCVPKCTIN